MPAKNIVKQYIENGIYHVYNRGVEKRNIFLDDQDYVVYLSYLKLLLASPKNIHLQGRTLKKSFHEEINLLAYCLMPNHFHLLIQQKSQNAMNEFIRSLCTRYAMYFNTKYKRVGPLFQSRYKAILITEEPYLLHLSRYIHLNPKAHIENLEDAYSSYSDYLDKRKTEWVKTELILSFFSNKENIYGQNPNSYKSFVEDSTIEYPSYLESLMLE